MLSKNSPDRIKQLLKVINYVAAPFGTKEYLVANYGVQGQDYQLDENGNPTRTKQGVSNMIPWQGVMGGPPVVLFDPQLIAKYQRRFPGFDDKVISTTK